MDDKIFDKLDTEVEASPTPLRSMLKNSSLVYDYASLRGLVNKHDKFMSADIDEKKRAKDLVEFDTPALVVTKNSDNKSRHLQSTVLKHEVSFTAILEFLQKNRNLMNNDLETLRPEEDRMKKPEEFEELRMEKNLKKMINRFDISVWEFDDEFESSELVFSIVINKTEKRIVCVFRGSMTGSDWLTNFNAFITNPAVTREFAPEAGLHQGFAKYLYSKEWTTETDPCKFEQIMMALNEIRAKEDDKGNKLYADYGIFVTGHSLGGALSQLLAFGMAGSDRAKDLPKPITAVTFASPQPGNQHYVKAFQKLEKEGTLRHIRVSNKGDHVCVQPTVPFFGFSQTGVNIHVLPEGKAEVGYRGQRSAFSAFAGAISPITALKMHGLPTYFERLVGHEENKDLMEMSVDDFYNEYAGDFTN